MAVNWEKYNKPVERRKPVIFLMNMSATDLRNTWSSGVPCEREWLTKIIIDLIKSFRFHNIRADVSIVGFGSEVSLILPYTDVCDIKIEELTQKLYKTKVTSSAVFGTGLLATKDMLEDLDETPANIFVPTVILLTTNEPSQGWENCLEAFIKEGRSSKSQRMAIYSDPNDSATEFSFSNIYKMDKMTIDSVSSAVKEALSGEANTKKELSKMDKVKNKAVKAFAERGIKVPISRDGMSGTEQDSFIKHLSFTPLDEEQPLVEVKKEDADIPILENAEFDGNNMDEDSFI